MGVAGALAGCVALDKTDAFPVGTPPVSIASIQALTDSGATASVLPVMADGSVVHAYVVHHAQPRGVLVLMGGSGNEIVAPVKNFAGRTGALGLDLVVFSYYYQGEPIPSVAEVRVRARAVLDAVKQRYAGQPIYVVGYSLGGWFALDVGSDASVAGMMLVGAETTPAEVIRRTYAPWSAVVAVRPDDDQRQLDASRYVPYVHAPTLVVTSGSDEAVPEAVGRELYAMLPRGVNKKLVVLQGVTHGRYFLSNALWSEFGAFFGLN